MYSIMFIIFLMLIQMLVEMLVENARNVILGSIDSKIFGDHNRMYSTVLYVQFESVAYLVHAH